MKSAQVRGFDTLRSVGSEKIMENEKEESIIHLIHGQPTFKLRKKKK